MSKHASSLLPSSIARQLNQLGRRLLYTWVVSRLQFAVEAKLLYQPPEGLTPGHLCLSGLGGKVAQSLDSFDLAMCGSLTYLTLGCCVCFLFGQMLCGRSVSILADMGATLNNSQESVWTSQESLRILEDAEEFLHDSSELLRSPPNHSERAP